MPDITIKTDAQARERALTEILPLVQQTVPTADLAYVYTLAAQVGLRRICTVMSDSLVMSWPVNADDLATQTGVDVQDTVVALTTDQHLAAQAKAITTRLPIENIVGSAVLTGIHLLLGYDPGPMGWMSTSRLFVRPFG